MINTSLKKIIIYVNNTYMLKNTLSSLFCQFKLNKIREVTIPKIAPKTCITTAPPTSKKI